MRSAAVLKKLLVSLVVVGAVGGVINSGTFATFTAEAKVENNTFATGTLDLVATPAATRFEVTGMAPGDVVIEPLDLENTGTLELRYGLVVDATNGDETELANQLVLSVGPLSGADSCQAVDFDANTIYSGILAAGAFDKTRVLEAGAVETLCFRVELPIDTDNKHQGAKTTATFTFNAEQTANNPL